MEYILNFCEWIGIYAKGAWNIIQIWTIIFRFFMIIAIGLFSFSLVSYFMKYKIIQSIIYKFIGNTQEYDRIRREQMRKEIELSNNAFAPKERKKSSILTKVYMKISQTGLLEKIPGFSELGLVMFVLCAATIILIYVGIMRGILAGLIVAGAFLVVVYYLIDMVAYNRKIRLETQLLQFVNACSSASSQYSNIIDIFGVIYDQFSSPLREGLEACYIEAKKTNNKELALRHFKEKYNSTQLAFIVDNMEMCSAATGDYFSITKDLSEIVTIHSGSFEKQKAMLKGAKGSISAMFCIGIVIIGALSAFFGGIKELLFGSTLSIALCTALFLLWFYAMNIRTKE